MIGRRDALTVIGGGVTLAAAPAMARGGLDLTTPDQRLRTFMLMRGALDDRLVMGCLEGRYYGVVNGVTKPMFGFCSVTFSRYRKVAQGYEGITLEQAYFLDDAGNWIKRYANPYTGKTVDVPVGGYPPARILFTPDLEMHFPNARPGQVLKHASSGFRVDGAHTWLTETTDGVTPDPRGGTPLEYHEVVGLHARTAELAAPDVKRVPCETSYTSTKSWRPWLDMKGHEGETVSMGQGMYGATLADLPKPWLAAARQHRPELLSDPARALDSLWRARG